MAHFAQLDENNIVTQVIVVDNKDTSDSNGVEIEEIGIEFCKSLLGPDTKWVKTSYNNNVRVRYAGIGYVYNEELDAFIPPKPYESWVLNTTTVDWESPLGPAPELTQEEIESNSVYAWDEENCLWVLRNQDYIPLVPRLTEEQVQSGQYYRWDEEESIWVLDTYDSPPPSEG